MVTLSCQIGVTATLTILVSAVTESNHRATQEVPIVRKCINTTQRLFFPKFNSGLLLEKLRNKRLVFVEDSLNRNQWDSMNCMVHSVGPPGRKTWEKSGSLSVFRIKDCNATVEFCSSNSNDPEKHNILDRIIMPELIEKHDENRKDVDYLFFNSYIWWTNTFTMIESYNLLETDI